MSATKLAVAVALLVSATSAALAQGPQCYGDRPYYDFYGAGWLDSELHLGIDCNIARPPVCIPADTAGEAAADRQLRSTSSWQDGWSERPSFAPRAAHVRSITIAGAPSTCPAAQVFRSHVDSRHRLHGRMPSNPADQRSPTRA